MARAAQQDRDPAWERSRRPDHFSDGPLVAAGATVTVDLTIDASRPEGIPRNTLNLTVKEGLRQLGIDHELTQPT